jgi:hypothetical protein
MKISAFKNLLLLVAIGLLSACDSNDFPDPDEVLTDYLQAVYTGQNEVAYSYISSEDKRVKSLNDYLAENKNRANPIAREFVDEFEVRIVSLNQSDTNAAIKVSIILPDLDGMLKGLETKSGTSEGNSLEPKVAAEMLKKKYKDMDVPTVYKNESFQLVNQQGAWKVHLDWQAEILQKAREEQIAKLLAQARELRKSDSTLEDAIEKYKEVLELDSNMAIALHGIKDTEQEIKAYEQKLAYIPNVSLYDLEAKFYKTYSKTKVPGVKFKIKNNGDRLLQEVEVTVYFKNANGTVIAEERYRPVLAMKKSFSGNQVILKENYIWQMEEGNFYKAEGVPTEWQEGAVEAKVTNIKFAE